MQQQHDCKCESDLAECEYPLHSAIMARTQADLGWYMGGVDQPAYIISLDEDAKTDVAIVDTKTPETVLEDLKPISPIHGDAYEIDTYRHEWTEPVVAIGVSYDRDYRWAYITDKTDDHAISAEDLHVHRIHGGTAPLELYTAHEDTTVLDLIGNIMRES